MKLAINENLFDLADIRLFAGYSGWATGQLEQEMKEKSWLVAELSENIVFDTDTENLWKKSVKCLGKDYSYLLNIPSDPQLN